MSINTNKKSIYTLYSGKVSLLKDFEAYLTFLTIIKA